MQTQKLVLPSRQGATRWTIDTTHTTAEYSLRHLFTHFRGVFRGVEGSITHDPANPDLTKVVARIDARNIDTGLADRDAHLRSGFTPPSKLRELLRDLPA